MPIPAHLRITLDGTLSQATGGGSEIWTTSVASQSGQTPQALATALGPVLRNFWGSTTDQGISASVALTGVSVEQISLAGAVTASYRAAITPKNGGNDPTICTILSHCVTLETDAQNDHGGSVRGRFYPPASMAVMGSTANAAQVTTYTSQWAGLINAMNDQGALVSVASTTMGGQVVAVTGVSVDNIVDTVRRRKNHLTSVRGAVVAIPA
uniref:Uncharacterized protein n=1 Tax=uncultured prokaryote TaxID=198431 RepID=A0A0H5Q4J1_9ZZZZ|nr:hypothetical protein [uncultured prokaryote]